MSTKENQENNVFGHVLVVVLVAKPYCSMYTLTAALDMLPTVSMLNIVALD